MKVSPRLALLCLLLLAMAAAAFWPAPEAEAPPLVARPQGSAPAGPLAMAWLGDPRRAAADTPASAAALIEPRVETRTTAPEWSYEVLGALQDAQGWRVFLAHEGQALTVRAGDHLQAWQVLGIDAQGRWLQVRAGGLQRQIELPRPSP